MNKNKVCTIVAWCLIALTVIYAVLLTLIPEKNLVFTALLLFNLLVFIRYRRRFNKDMIAVCRTLLGLLFIFSGFVKGVDPLGTKYQILDYFTAFHMTWANPLALFGSFALNAAEFLLGIFLLFNLWPKLTGWLVMLFMGVMTLVTLNDALYNVVPDCGCFGKALTLTNWQTFNKNLIIDAFVLAVFLSRGRIKAGLKQLAQWSVALLAALLFVGFQAINYRHLPMIDFVDWQVGMRLFPEEKLPVKNFVTYKNEVSGETKEFLSKDIPWSDPEFKENWTYVDSRIEDPNEKTTAVAVFDFETLEDITEILLNNPDEHYVAVAYDLSKSNKKGWQEMSEFLLKKQGEGVDCMVFTAEEDPEVVAAFKATYQLEDIPFYLGDDISLKSIVRSNPGLILLKDATVVKKWAWRDIPCL